MNVGAMRTDSVSAECDSKSIGIPKSSSIDASLSQIVSFESISSFWLCDDDTTPWGWKSFAPSLLLMQIVECTKAPMLPFDSIPCVWIDVSPSREWPSFTCFSSKSVDISQSLTKSFVVFEVRTKSKRSESGDIRIHFQPTLSRARCWFINVGHSSSWNLSILIAHLHADRGSSIKALLGHTFPISRIT